ncbi:MAG: hypothetical protein NC828_00925 [Candidatus Omnitrophica bacterium]|nr:hypothetical protein [Candidatus Omnitrophota bacterium]
MTIWVLKNFEVKFFVENGDKEDNPLYLECRQLLKDKGIKRFVVQEGDCIKGFKEVEICVLNPPTEKFAELNDNSLVLKLKYKSFSAIFCADIKENAASNLLLTQGEKLASTVLKVPHHGGSLGFAAAEFLEKINPKVAVISTRNKKIDKRILLILNKLGTRVYKTYLDGAIFLKTDGINYIIGGKKITNFFITYS